MWQRIAELIPRLRRYARALGGAGQAPDELVRRTLQRASRELSAPLADAELRVWLFSVLHETYVQSGPVLEAERLQAAAPAGAVVADLREAITALPPLQREVFLLVTLEEMSYEQVAKALDLPVGMVMSHLARGRETLRLLLPDAARVPVVK
jgi:RNA polymerase sigma-70 factor (ECF subfamily)